MCLNADFFGSFSSVFAELLGPIDPHSFPNLENFQAIVFQLFVSIPHFLLSLTLTTRMLDVLL